MSSLAFCFRTSTGKEESYFQSGVYGVNSDVNSEFFGSIRCSTSLSKYTPYTSLVGCYFRGTSYDDYPRGVPTPSFPLALTLFLWGSGNTIRYDFVLDNLSAEFTFPTPFPHTSLFSPSFAAYYGSADLCESIQATHYQIRWEFDRIVALDSDGNSGNYHLSQIFPIPSGGVDDVVHRFAGFLAPYVSSRIRFCDANGAIKPYRGSGYIAHVLNADGSGALMGNTSFSASSPDVLYTAVTPLTQSLADGVGTTSVNTLVSFSASDEVLSDDCETIEPPGDEDDEVELPEGEDPPDGEDPPERKDGEKGKRKDDPDPVETCECYDIINQRLTDINNNIAILNDNILEQMQVHNDTFAILITKMQEWTRYLSGQWREIMFEKNKYDDLRQKRLKQFLTSGSGEKIADSVQRATDALYVSDSDSVHDGDSIADLHDSVFHSSINSDFSITDAIENIEPVHIENEYRTQSHRVIDNFDSTQNL